MTILELTVWSAHIQLNFCKVMFSLFVIVCVFFHLLSGASAAAAGEGGRLTAGKKGAGRENQQLSEISQRATTIGLHFRGVFETMGVLFFISFGRIFIF